MCTVTIVPRSEAGGLRLVCNRDELRTRSRARTPERLNVTNCNAVGPVDGESGGTWVGVSDVGLVATLLNVNPRTPPPWTAKCSRGLIVLRVLECDSLDAVANTILALDHTDYRPFRLVAALGEQVIEVRSDAEGPHIGGRWTNAVCFFTSSGLGDHRVEGPRRALFDSMFGGVTGSERIAVQDAFHRHVWDDRPELSVNMSRSDAQTVSLTTIECDDEKTRILYIDGRPGDEDHGRDTVDATLARRTAVR